MLLLLLLKEITSKAGFPQGADSRLTSYDNLRNKEKI